MIDLGAGVVERGNGYSLGGASCGGRARLVGEVAGVDVHLAAVAVGGKADDELLPDRGNGA